MAVYKRERSKFYWTTFVFRGERIQRSTKCTNKQKALDYESDLRHQLNWKGLDLDVKKEKPKAFTFAQDCEAYLASLTGRVKESTIRRYETASKAPLEFFRKQTIADLERKDIDAFITWRQNQKKKAPARLLKKHPKAKTSKPLMPATINRELALIRTVVNYAKPGHWQAITNPDRSHKLKFLSEDSKKDRHIEPGEIRRYLRACTRPLKDVARIMLYTGMRPSEVLALDCPAINFFTGFIDVTAGKTSAAKRRIKMNGRVRAIARRLIKGSPNNLLFPGGKNGAGEDPIVKLNNAHHAALDRSGVRSTIRLYDFRHTFATTAVEAGVDLLTLMRLLGHSDIKMVMRYAHPTEQHQADAIDKMARHRSATESKSKTDSVAKSVAVYGISR